MSNERRGLPLAAPDEEPGRELLLSATPHPAAGNRAIAISRGAAAGLTSVHTWTLSVTAGPSHHGNTSFTFDVPNVPPEKLAHLDDDGVVRVGTEVRPGTVLVGRVEPVAAVTLSPEEQQLDRIFGTRSDVKDVSLRCPPDARGTVVAVERSGSGKKKDPLRVDVTIALERPLEVGDVLCAGGEERIVGAIVGSIVGADAAWPGMGGPHRVLKIACAEEVLHARHIGPYSLVTQQPLGGKAQWGGQRVGEAEIEALRARGAVHTLHELMTVKSDDAEGRLRLYESIVLGRPECAPSVPRATRVLERELMAMAFDVDFESGSVGIRLSSTKLIREEMPGAVTKPETLNYRTLLPEKDGLFCEAIFGPLGSAERATRLGRFELPAPLLHPFAVEAVATVLDVSVETIRDVLDCKQTLDGEEPEDAWRNTGAIALRAAVGRIDVGAMSRDDGPRGELARALLASDTPATAFFFDAWPVLPPDLRPLVPLDDGRFATSDLNDLYRRLINRGNRMRRLMELDAPPIILRNEYAQLQNALDSLVENGRWDRTLTGPNGRPLKSLADMIQGPSGRFAHNLLGKRVDYSAIAHVVPCADLAPSTVRLSRAAARELFRPWIYEALERHGHAQTIKVAKALLEAGDANALAALEEVATGYPVILVPHEPSGSPAPVVALDVELWDAPAIGVPALAYDLLGQPRSAVVHVPVDPRAVEEARTRLRFVHEIGRAREDEPAGWIGRAARERSRLAPLLLDAAVRGEVDPVRDGIAQLVLGRLIGA